MADPISNILTAHIKLAEQQLEYVRAGVSFEEFDLGAQIPVTEQDLLKRIFILENALGSHEARMANNAPPI
jgi:hypothetical protein